MTDLLINRPPVPPFIKELDGARKNVEKKIKEMDISKTTRSALFYGMIFAILAFLAKGFMGLVAGFIIGFIVSLTVGEIVDAMPDSKDYTTSQKIMTFYGFALAFVALLACIVILDIYVLQNVVYQTGLLIIEYLSNMLPELYSNIVNYLKNIINNMQNTPINQTQPDFLKKLSEYKTVIGSVAIACMILLYARNDANAMTTNTSYYASLMLIPLILALFFYSPLINSEHSAYLMTLGGGFIVLLLFMFLYYSSWTSSFSYYGGYAMKIIATLAVIVGLAITSKLYSNKLKNMTGWPGFFMNMFFFIPCMFSDFVDYVMQQWKLTPNSVNVMMIFEIILIALYLTLPTIMRKINSGNEMALLKRPVFLRYPLTVSNSEPFLIPTPIQQGISVDVQNYRTNYAIGMWVYLNPQTQQNGAYSKETAIFNYGEGKPKLAYINNNKNQRLANRDTYVAYFSNNGEDAKYEISVENQKWNYFVFNYFDSKVDLYVNGSLARTFEFSDNMPTYSASDMITVGSENGLDGSICNLKYYVKPLDKTEIAKKYNIYSLKNPPVDFW